MDEGLDPEVFHHIIQKMVYDRPFVLNKSEVVRAMELEYTFWAKPDNKSAVRQNLIDVGNLVKSSVLSIAIFNV